MPETLTERQVLDCLRDEYGYDCRLADLAARFGCSVQFVSAVLKGRKRPNPAMLESIGVRRVTRYETIK